MLPLTLLAASKVSSLLTSNNALQQTISALSVQFGVILPPITAGNIVESSAGQELSEMNAQLTFPECASIQLM